MLVLAIGDFHVPERAVGLPEKFKRLLQPRGKIQQVLCTGNVSSSPSSMEFLKSISSDFQMVNGDHDKNLWLPLSLVFKYGKLKVGLISGFEVVPKSDPLSLLAQARMMDVDILIYGSTHKVEAYTLDGKFFINPGSATGAFNSDSMDADDVDIIEGIIKESIDAKKVESHENEKTGESESESTNKTGDDVQDSKTVENEDTGEIDKDEKAEGDPESLKTSSEKSLEEDEKEQEVDKANDKKEGVNEDTHENPNEEKDKGEKKQKDLNDSEEADEKLDTSEIEPYMDPIPSFCLLDLQDATCTLYLYTLIDGDVKVDKLVYKKEEVS